MGIVTFGETFYSKPVIRYCDPFESLRIMSDVFFDNMSKNNTQTGYPKYDQYNRNDGSVVLEFSLAGYIPEHLSVIVDGAKLIVSSQKSEIRKDGERAVSWRSSQSFERVFTAHENLDLDKTKAAYQHGLLILEIPSRQKENAERAKKIEIVVS